MCVYEKQKIELIEYANKLVESEYVHGTGGNISLRSADNSEIILITPSGMEYCDLVPDDIAVCDLNCKVIEGRCKPSIELGMHSGIYKSRKDVLAIMHSHSIYSLGLAMSRKPLPAVQASLVFIGNPIEIAEYANPGTPELAENVVRSLAGNGAVLLANHGLVTVSTNLKSAYEIVEKIEISIRAYLYAKIFGGAVAISQEEGEELIEFVKQNYGQK